MSFCAPKEDVQCFEHHDVWEFGNFPEVGIHTADASHGVEVSKPPPELKISPLQYIDTLTRILTDTWYQRMGPLDSREQRSEVGSVLLSEVGINTNLRDHFMEVKEGSPILLLLVRVGHSA